MYTSLLSANWLKYFAFCDSCEWSGQIHPETVALKLGNKTRISESKRNPKGSSRPVRRASLLPSGEAVLPRCVFKTHLTASSLFLSLCRAQTKKILFRTARLISPRTSDGPLTSFTASRIIPCRGPVKKKIVSKLASALDAGRWVFSFAKKKRRVTVCQGGARSV